MTKDQVKAVLERVPSWPEDRQQELAEIAQRKCFLMPDLKRTINPGEDKNGSAVEATGV
jgi:hypothetical protein